MDKTVKLTLKDGRNTVGVTECLNGVTTEYSITLADLLAILQSNQSLTSYISPLLPKNCIKITDGNVQKVYIHVPKTQKAIFYGEKMLKLGFPHLIFKWIVQNEQIFDLYIYATKSDKFTAETEIYRFPYSNVYHDGRVCMGANKFPVLDNIKQLETLHNLFFGAPFNGELARGVGIRKIIKECNNKDFNDDFLEPTGKKLKNI